MDDLPVLYSFRRCPYAMRARLALIVSEQTVALREIVLRDKPDAFLQASPSASVPCMILPDDTVIDESLDIMIWALKQTDPLDWLPPRGAAFDDAMKLISECDGAFKTALDGYKYAPLDERKNVSDSAIAHRASAMIFIEQLDGRLALSAGLAGDRLSLLDAAIAPFIRQFANVDAEWFASQNVPHLQDWLTAFTTSDLFSCIMQKYEPWKAGDPEITFG